MKRSALPSPFLRPNLRKVPRADVFAPAVAQYLTRVRTELHFRQKDVLLKLAPSLVVPASALSELEHGYGVVTPLLLRLLVEVYDVTLDRVYAAVTAEDPQHRTDWRAWHEGLFTDDVRAWTGPVPSGDGSDVRTFVPQPPAPTPAPAPLLAAPPPSGDVRLSGKIFVYGGPLYVGQIDTPPPPLPTKLPDGLADGVLRALTHVQAAQVAALGSKTSRPLHASLLTLYAKIATLAQDLYDTEVDQSSSSS